MGKGWRARASLAALGLALLALGAWLSIPRPVRDAPALPAVRAVVLDASASVARPRRGLASHYLTLVENEAQAAAAAGQELLVVRLAPQVRRLVGPCAPGDWAAQLGGPWRPLVARGEDTGTPLVAALEATEPWLLGAERPPGELVLCTDGSWTGEDPRGRLDALVRSGCRVRRRPLPQSNLDDAGIVEFAGPGFSAAQEPVALRLDWRMRPAANSTAEARVELLLAGPGGQRSITQALEQTTGSGTSRARLEVGALESGLWRIRAHLQVGAGDRTAEDNTATVLHRVGAAPLVGMVAGAEELAALRSAWTRAAPRGLNFDWCTPGEFLGRLPYWDAVVTFDRGPGDLPGPAMREFVNAGGGWLAMGGVGLFDGLGGSDLSEVLPIEPREEDRKPRDVVLLVDGSGSMNEREPGRVSRWDRVRSAVQELVLLVSPEDRVQVWFFTHDLVRPAAFEGQGGGQDVGALQSLLAARAPGGITNIVDSVHTYTTLREQESAAGREALVLLLSDGYQNSNSFRSPSALRARLGATGATLRVLGIGGRPKLPLLRAFLPEGEDVVMAGDLSDLQRLLVEEVFGDRVRREPGLEGRLVAAAELRIDGPSRAIRAAMERGEGLPLAPMAGYLRVQRSSRAASDAEVLMVGADQEPLLALGSFGLGHSAALVTLPTAAWSQGLAARPSLLGPLLRLLTKPSQGGRQNSRSRAHLVGATLRLRGLDPSLPAQLIANLKGPADRAPQGLAGQLLIHVGPDPLAPDPRTARVGTLGGDVAVPGDWASVVLQTQDREWLSLPLEVGLPSEWAERSDRLPILWPEPSPRAIRGQTRSHPLAPWALFLGLVCMTAAAWIRVRPSVTGTTPRFGGQGAG